MKLSRLLWLASFSLVAFRCAGGQQTGKEIVIEVKDALSQLRDFAETMRLRF